MRNLSYLTTFIIVGVFAFGCSTTPNGPDISDQLIEFNALETDLSSMDVVPEPETDQATTDINIKRLEDQILRLKRFLRRLANYEEKHPNDEAHKLIKQAVHWANSAHEAFENKEYRKAFRMLRQARKLAHEALTILRPVTDKAPDGG